MSVMRPWIIKKVTEYELDDEIVVEFVTSLLEDPSKTVVGTLTTKS